jgi:hypothetical protein
MDQVCRFAWVVRIARLLILSTVMAMLVSCMSNRGHGDAVNTREIITKPMNCLGTAKGCGKVLYIGGEMPMVGIDLQLHQLLKEMGFQVEDVRENAATLANANGKQLIVLSCSMKSTDFKAEEWARLPVPMIVFEHFILPGLGMTKLEDHGYKLGQTDITITSDDPVFTAGFPKGNVTVYGQTGEFFWGIPGPGAIIIATVVDRPNQPVTFGYPTGSMMVGMVAPARRVQIFVAVHAPPANPTQFLNANGLRLFGGAVAWALK